MNPSDHRIPFIGVAFMLALGGCTGVPNREADDRPATPSATASPDATNTEDALPPAAQGLEPCPGDADREFVVRTGGRRITGLVRGSGDRVAVLSHQSRGTPCDLAALGALLNKAGFRVVAWTADSGIDVKALKQLVARERARGAANVVLVGASAGGARSLVAAGAIEPPVDAVVALSPPDLDLVAGDVERAVERYDGPMMVVAGEGDPGFAEVPAKLQPLHDGPEDIRAIAGSSSHGKDFVLRRTEPLAADVVAFLTQHAG
ncbi:MAG: hypothetical protein H0U35_09425 [Sporichthyaceae bacterium]|nr:hypothetical protein [Sporichthyaceae bacterium]